MAGSKRKWTFPCESNSRNYVNRTIKQERRIMFAIEERNDKKIYFMDFFLIYFRAGGVRSHETRLICCKSAVWFIFPLHFPRFQTQNESLPWMGSISDESLMSNCWKIPLISPDGTELMTFRSFRPSFKAACLLLILSCPKKHSIFAEFIFQFCFRYYKLFYIQLASGNPLRFIFNVLKRQ